MRYSPKKDISGQVFGSLTAIEPTNSLNTSGSIVWKFKCACGNDYLAAGAAIKAASKQSENPVIPSCGCQKSDIAAKTAKKNLTTHGYTNSDSIGNALYKVRLTMIARCYNPNNKQYPSYGGKGVTVCKEWLDSPESFVNWCLANNWKPGMQIDKDIIGDSKEYSPTKCKIVTQLENNHFAHSRETSYGKNKSIKLSKEEVDRILSMYSEGTYSQYDLSKIFNVTRSAIQRLVNTANIVRKTIVN